MTKVKYLRLENFHVAFFHVRNFCVFNFHHLKGNGEKVLTVKIPDLRYGIPSRTSVASLCSKWCVAGFPLRKGSYTVCRLKNCGHMNIGCFYEECMRSQSSFTRS